MLNLCFDRHHKSTQEFHYNGIARLEHDLIYFLYRYGTFKTIGDQFVGLFKKEEK